MDLGSLLESREREASSSVQSDWQPDFPIKRERLSCYKLLGASLSATPVKVEGKKAASQALSLDLCTF